MTRTTPLKSTTQPPTPSLPGRRLFLFRPRGGDSGGGDREDGSASSISILKTANERGRLGLPGSPTRARTSSSRSPTAPPGDQARAVIAGLKADEVHLSLEPDMTKLTDENLVDQDWKSGANKGIATQSVVAIVTRKGNPKGIKTWDDLVKPGVKRRRLGHVPEGRADRAPRSERRGQVHSAADHRGARVRRLGHLRMIEGVDAIDLPAQQRNVGFVFQHYAAFKHMWVYLERRVRSGRSRKPKAEIDERVVEFLELVHLSQFSERLPAQLSGGQRQRMALARAGGGADRAAAGRAVRCARCEGPQGARGTGCAACTMRCT